MSKKLLFVIFGGLKKELGKDKKKKMKKKVEMRMIKNVDRKIVNRATRHG